jgi:hypothetical protein
VGRVCGPRRGLPPWTPAWELRGESTLFLLTLPPAPRDYVERTDRAACKPTPYRALDSNPQTVLPRDPPQSLGRRSRGSSPTPAPSPQNRASADLSALIPAPRGRNARASERSCDRTAAGQRGSRLGLVRRDGVYGSRCSGESWGARREQGSFGQAVRHNSGPACVCRERVQVGLNSEGVTLTFSGVLGVRKGRAGTEPGSSASARLGRCRRPNVGVAEGRGTVG